ncbi:MAG: NAD(P)H-dependent glycerol-3-phosphate dehydrogenase, partial [Planctomycetaceae bacterium]|nr:NAD(P)H-dependent glycerol-3-phosphate dehydrogenase [Planctomycetaceae bacterium]
PAVAVAVISGPNLAREVAAGQPAAGVIACERSEAARELQGLFTGESFRAYTSTDVLGVELAGALKNVIALAVGMTNELGLGANAQASLVTRGLAEMARLGAALGAQAETFRGLAGMGDLMVTCASRHGRNRAVGERIGRGESLEAILAGMEMVAEGVATTRSLVPLARRLGVEMPIAAEVHRVLFEGKDPLRALTDLMLRAPKRE